MTTVDVYIGRADDPSSPHGPSSLSLHNGLFGPATSALHALADQFQAGTLTGPWNCAHIETTAPGTVIRAVLAAVDENDRAFRDADRDRFLAFRETIDDDAEYLIAAIEF